MEGLFIGIEETNISEFISPCCLAALSIEPLCRVCCGQCGKDVKTENALLIEAEPLDIPSGMGRLVADENGNIIGVPVDEDGNIIAVPVYNDICYEELDEGIRELVRELNEAGFETTSSCEGGPGHACPLPMVVIKGDVLPELRRKLIAYMQGRMIECTVSENYICQVNRIMPESFVKIELWRK